jgi:S-formylglutathione hydrolase FrmB
MAFCELRYFSPALQKQTAANVLLPEGEKMSGPFPVFYLLHGLSDDYTIWHRRTSIERYVQGLPLIVVMPDGGRSFYTDAEQGYAYETAIIRDLIGYIDRIFPTKAERAGRCIGGLSMGGYGALRLALRFPGMFCSAVSHSGKLDFAREEWNGPHAEEFARIVGKHPRGGPNDLFALAEKVDRSLLPALRFDCGTEDALLGCNRDFHIHLQNLGIPHEYAEYPGGHDWAYWDLRVQEAIAFHMPNLGIAPSVET